jgi:cobalamin biosynthesis Mg chelatase CobN
VRRHLGAAAALAVVAIGVGATPASAGGPLAPGDTWGSVVALPGAWTGQADRLGVSVVDLEQHENGCLRPETMAGDTSCEPGDGELAEQLTAMVTAGVLTGGTCAVSGAAAPLSLLDAAVTRLSVDRASCLSLRLEFDDAGAAGDDDNLAQSDTLGFSLRIVAEGPDGVDDSGSTPVTVVPDGGNPVSVTAPAQPAAAGRAPAGRPAVPGTGTGGAAVAQQPVAGSPLGQVDASVSVGGDVSVRGDSVAVRTESATTSLTQLVVLWGSLLLGSVLVGWLLFLVWRRRRQGGAA